MLINRKNLLNALKTLSITIPTRYSIDIVKQIHILFRQSSVSFLTTNFNSSTIYKVIITSDCVELDSIVSVDFKLFRNIIKSSKNTSVSITLNNDNALQVDGSIIESTYPPLSTSDLNFDLYGGSKYITELNDFLGNFRDNLDQVSYCISKDTKYKSLTGVLFKNDTATQDTILCASDGIKFAESRFGGLLSMTDFEKILSEEFVKIIKSLDNKSNIGKCIVYNEKLVFTIYNTTNEQTEIVVSSKFIDEQYPKYNSIMCTNSQHIISFNFDNLRDIITKCYAISTVDSVVRVTYNYKTSTATFIVKNDKIINFIETLGFSTIKNTKNAEEETIWYNASMLLEHINALGKLNNNDLIIENNVKSANILYSSGCREKNLKIIAPYKIIKE